MKNLQLNKTYFWLETRSEGLYLEAPCNCGMTQYGWVPLGGRVGWGVFQGGGEGGLYSLLSRISYWKAYQSIKHSYLSYKHVNQR